MRNPPLAAGPEPGGNRWEEAPKEEGDEEGAGGGGWCSYFHKLPLLLLAMLLPSEVVLPSDKLRS
jgi:hypothetical protein